jgi:hypothetical protein
MNDNAGTQENMRVDPDTCRDPDLLAAEVRRLRAVIAAIEPSPAPAGSVRKPVAWGIQFWTGDIHYEVFGTEEQAEREMYRVSPPADVCPAWVVPMYIKPSLTDAEREAVEVAAEAYAADQGEQFATTLRGLLERLK